MIRTAMSSISARAESERKDARLGATLRDLIARAGGGNTKNAGQFRRHFSQGEAERLSKMPKSSKKKKDKAADFAVR